MKWYLGGVLISLLTYLVVIIMDLDAYNVNGIAISLILCFRHVLKSSGGSHRYFGRPLARTGTIELGNILIITWYYQLAPSFNFLQTPSIQSSGILQLRFILIEWKSRYKLTSHFRAEAEHGQTCLR